MFDLMPILSPIDNNDPFDPRTWDELLAKQAAEVNHVYLDDRLTHAALIDPIDYEWAHQWRWCAKRDPTGSIYARRAVGENAHGSRLRTFTVYLHVQIMRRTKKRRPSARHVLVDHRNGNSLDCRRKNLRWATPSMNGRNRFAYAPSCLVDDHMMATET